MKEAGSIFIGKATILGRLTLALALLAALAIIPSAALAQDITVTGGPGSEVGKLPHVIATFIISGDILPLGIDAFNVFALFDTGSDWVRIDPDTAEKLLITTDLLQTDIRVSGIGALDPTSLSTPVYSDPAEIVLLGIYTTLEAPDRTLLGGPVIEDVKAVIDYTNLVTIGPYLDDPDGEIFEGPDITLYPSGSEVGFTPQITLNLQALTPVTNPLYRGNRYLMYDVTFHEGSNSVASNSFSDGNTNEQGKRFLYDTGTTVTELDAEYADDLGLDLSDPAFITPLGDSIVPGFYLDSITMSGPEGTYTVMNAPVVVVELGPSLTAVIGSNIFSQVKLLWDGPNATLGISMPAINESPVAYAGDDQVIEATGPTTSFTLNGTGSSDPDADTLAYVWSENGLTVGEEAIVELSRGCGTYIFALTVTDPGGMTSTDDVSITIQDTTPPDLTPPPNIEVEEGDPRGTTVYLGEPLVDDICDKDITPIHDAPTLFPLGNTTVTWTATDDSGNVSTAQQTVTVVPGPPLNQLNNLVKLIGYSVVSGDIAPEMQTSLLAKINAAIDALVKGNSSASKVAMNDLKALVNQVEAQTDKKITPSIAAEIITRANRIIGALGG